MTQSNRNSPVALDAIALTPADIVAMRRSAAESSTLSTEEYLRFLERASAHVEPSRRTSEGWLPFDLRDIAVRDR